MFGPCAPHTTGALAGIGAQPTRKANEYRIRNRSSGRVRRAMRRATNRATSTALSNASARECCAGEAGAHCASGRAMAGTTIASSNRGRALPVLWRRPPAERTPRERKHSRTVAAAPARTCRVVVAMARASGRTGKGAGHSIGARGNTRAPRYLSHLCVHLLVGGPRLSLPTLVQMFY